MLFCGSVMGEAFDGMDWNTRIERAGSTRRMNTLQNKTIMIYDANAFLNHAPGDIVPLSPPAGKQTVPATGPACVSCVYPWQRPLPRIGMSSLHSPTESIYIQPADGKTETLPLPYSPLEDASREGITSGHQSTGCHQLALPQNTDLEHLLKNGDEIAHSSPGISSCRNVGDGPWWTQSSAPDKCFPLVTEHLLEVLGCIMILRCHCRSSPPLPSHPPHARKNNLAGPPPLVLPQAPEVFCGDGPAPV